MPVTIARAEEIDLISAIPSLRAPDIEITAGASPEQWDAFVGQHPVASRYHVWGWRQVFENAFGHETVYLAARHAGAIVGVLPLVIFRSRLFGKFAVSLPFVDGGGLVASDPTVRGLLVDRARTIAAERGLSHVELRHTARLMPELPVRQHKVGMALPLEPDAERAWAALDRKVRNQIRKAEKSGLVARRGGVELLDAFYDVFARNMRDLGTPVYSPAFFRHVLSTFADTASVFLVEQDTTVVAAGIALAHRQVLAVPWASSLREFRAQSPNNLLYWRIIEHAIAQKMTTFDFGRSTPGEGTFQFKEQWGAQPSPLYWEYVLSPGAELPDLTTKSPRFQAAIATWKRLPVPLTRWLGPHIVRSIP
ncbi:MAG: FemAB family XrtA/PEP-CTERM system-associated protein [Vicinamibacterales bacterium]